MIYLRLTYERSRLIHEVATDELSDREEEDEMELGEGERETYEMMRQGIEQHRAQDERYYQRMEEFNISNIYAQELYQNKQYLIEERKRAYFDHYKGLTPTHQYEHVDLSSPPPWPKGMCHQRYPPSMPS
ncbi:hypothetical protein E3N88_07075 [Mikania micrantha]|uniref:Uncharacterized protein n=1 Tax=Mikania micrantha TaxID=192012 RepID=A0A5N6PTC6_9ASTR|nr:hypothetical protein E3N88_07075 [Mikania micrantha]